MHNSDSQKSYNPEESKGNKVDINRETEDISDDDDVKIQMPPESYIHKIRVIRNSNAHNGK